MFLSEAAARATALAAACLNSSVLLIAFSKGNALSRRAPAAISVHAAHTPLEAATAFYPAPIR